MATVSAGRAAAASERSTTIAARLDPALLLVLAGATAIRFATLGEQSLWYDEALTATRVLHGSLGATLSALVHIENTPPVYYIALWLWTRVLGDGVIALRSLSALAGVATVGVCWLIGRELASRRVGLVLAAIVSTSPLFVWYSQEARAYELFVLLSAVGFLYFLRARRRPSAANLAVWAGASILAFGTHYFAAFLVAAEAVMLLRAGGAWAVGAVAAAGAAMIPLILAQGGHGTGWIGNWALGSRLEATVQYYLLGESGKPLGRGILLLALLPVAAALALVRDRRAAAVCAGVGLAGIVVPLALAVIGFDYYTPRYLVAAWVPLSAVVALGAVRKSAVLAVLICAGNLAVVAAVDTRPSLERGDWRGVANALNGGARDRAVVAAVVGAAPLQYYQPQLRIVGFPQTVVIHELDLVGYTPIRSGATRLAGMRLVSRRTVHGLVVLRFRAARSLTITGQRLARLRLNSVDSVAVAPAAAIVARPNHLQIR